MIDVTVASAHLEADTILILDLVDATGKELPAFTAGAHIDVILDNGMTRQYSLSNDPGERHRYRLGVLKDPKSRGGSEFIHQSVTVGAKLRISAPRNLFGLAEAPNAHHILIAGGIGVTPILSMAHSLKAQGSSFDLHYCARSRTSAAFLDELEAAAFAPQVRQYFDDEGIMLDAPAAIGAPAPERHLYVCGPNGFMDFVMESARRLGWPESHIHREHFAAPAHDDSADTAFDIVLNSSGQRFTIPPGQSVAQVLDEQGIFIAVSCEQGICGTCLTPVLEGEPDHRDAFQTDEEKAANTHFTPCCSRARSPVLVLDL